MADSSSGTVNNDTSHKNENGEAAQHDTPTNGRPHRFSQFAEAIANPPPQVAVESVPEPVSNLAQLNCDDTATARPVVQPDDPFDRRSSAVVYAGEKPSRFRKYRLSIFVGLIIAVIILTGTVIGVVVSNRSHGGSNGGGVSTSSSSLSDQPSSTATSSADSSSSTGSSTTTASGSPTSVPSECADTSKYLKSVSFMSIAGQIGYNLTYEATYDPTECCTFCFTQVPDGCDSWFMNGGFYGTACTIIHGWSGKSSDATCPKGHTAVHFDLDANNASHVGGVGPCATRAL